MRIPILSLFGDSLLWENTDMPHLEKKKECREIEIKVPWGHISAKWWGSQNVRPILAIHGWLDNAGTFDTIIPLLPDHISVLAIDVPGHGLSSRLPDGVLYHGIDNVYIVRRIMKEYGWDTISIMGHSMGGITAFIFASMFPDETDFIIGLDFIRSLRFPVMNIMDSMATAINGSLMADERNCSEDEPPSYSYQDCIKRLHFGTRKSINKDKASFLLARNIQKSAKYPGQYYFSRDSRVKYINHGIWPHELYEELTAKLKKPYLLIKSSQSPRNDTKENHYANIARLKTNPTFEYHEIDGTHHVHLNEPEKVSRIINNFLEKHMTVRITKAKL